MIVKADPRVFRYIENVRRKLERESADEQYLRWFEKAGQIPEAGAWDFRREIMVAIGVIALKAPHTLDFTSINPNNMMSMKLAEILLVLGETNGPEDEPPIEAMGE